jgi:hypothetical protein
VLRDSRSERAGTLESDCIARIRSKKNLTARQRSN